MGNTISPNFTPVASSVGGLLIGLSALLLLHGAGEIMGFTGVFGNACISDLPHRSLMNPDNGWKFGFLASFLVTSKLIIEFGNFVPGGVFDSSTTVPWWIIALSGFLAGFGTRMANGCTSGHGICGVGRLSKRSIAAVATFMATAFLSSSLCSPVFPFIYQIARLQQERDLYPSKAVEGVGIGFTVFFGVAAVASFWRQLSHLSSEGEERKEGPSAMEEEFSVDQQEAQEAAVADEENNSKARSMVIIKMATAVVTGPLFAIGLILGGMVKLSKILGFFDLTGFWRGVFDPSLMLLFMGGIVVSFIGYQFVSGQSIGKVENAMDRRVVRRSSASGNFHIPTNEEIDARLIVGSALFGVSMGISGYCPSPSLILVIGGYFDSAVLWLPFFIDGWIMYYIFFESGLSHLRACCSKNTP